MAIEIIETDSKSEAFVQLTRLLDEDLVRRYGELQMQYAQYNKVDYLNHVIVLYVDQAPVACGAFKYYDTASVEIKRIFVKEQYRKQGLAKLILTKLEERVKEKGYICTILETGPKQSEAIHLYKNIGYQVTENYQPYVGMPNSICMKKML